MFFSDFRLRRPRPAVAATLAALLPLAGLLLLPGGISPAAGAGLSLDLRAPAQARARAKELTQAAFTAHERGDSARALALLDQAEILYPNQADSYNLRGAVHLRRGDYDRATSAFSRAAALDPDLWAAKFNLADIPFKQKDYPRARALFDRLVDGTDRYKATARWELAQYKAGLCCLLAGDEAGANRRLLRLVAPGSTPSAAGLHAQAALAFARRDAATGNRLLLAAQTGCKPAANALYLPSLAAAGWVTPFAAPTGGGPAGAVAANGRSGNSRLTYLPGNLPITEPELPGNGGAPGSSTGGTLMGVANGRAVPAPTPLVLPAPRLLVEPAPVLPEAPAPVAATSVPGVMSPTPIPASADPAAPTPAMNLSPGSPAPSPADAPPRS